MESDTDIAKRRPDITATVDGGSDVELTSLLPAGGTQADDGADSDAGDTNKGNVQDGLQNAYNREDNDSPENFPQNGGYSRSRSASVRFEEILVDVINATTIHVDWSPTTSTDEVHGYKLRYSIRDNSSYNEIFVTPGITNYTIGGLKPNTDYDVSVNAVDRDEHVIQHCGNGSQRTDTGEDDRPKSFDAPYLTAIVGVTLLVLAALVPITFLFMRDCGKCAAPSGVDFGMTDKSKDASADEPLKVPPSTTKGVRDREDSYVVTMATTSTQIRLKFTDVYKRQTKTWRPLKNNRQQ